MKGLEGKVAVVTGGASGIGMATGRAFVERGTSVVLVDVDERAGRDAERDLAGHPGAALFLSADVSDEDAIAQVMCEGAEHFGGLDILVNCAAAFVLRGFDATPEEWRRAFETNVFGYALCAKHAVPHFRRRGGGAIVSVSSISALIAQPGRVTYSAGKGALLSMTRCLALDLAPDRIRVNVVCPGTIWTPVNEAHIRETLCLDRDGADEHAEIGGRAMLRRTGDPEEVAEAVAFLASGSASFITGESLVVDGGEVGR